MSKKIESLQVKLYLHDALVIPDKSSRNDLGTNFCKFQQPTLLKVMLIIPLKDNKTIQQHNKNMTVSSETPVPSPNY